MPTSSQMNDLTTSANGGNIQAKLQPESHFFIEDKNFSQTPAQAFGPITPILFRTTSKVTLSGSKEVYAICRGTVFIQPQANSTTKVNLILKPFTQPIKGIAIKYFIYRGLSKDKFFSGGKLISNNGTEFTQLLWNQFNSYHSNEDQKPDFLERFIGMPETNTSQPGTDLIEKYFNKITTIVDEVDAVENVDEAYELPLVPRGMSFGSFTGDIGLDIVLDFGEYQIPNDPNPFKLNIKFARAEDGELKITNTGTTAQDLYQNKLIREACTQFIDPAAFYGMHANGAGKLYKETDPIPKTIPSDIADLISNFQTKHNLYIYIQANRQRSYNFYENYAYSDINPSNLLIGGDSSSMAQTTFGTDGWPIHVFDGVGLNEFYIQLTTDRNNSAALYVKTGSLLTANEMNFVRDKNLLPIDDPNTTVDLNFSLPTGFSAPSIGTDSISSLVDIIYEGKQMVVEEYFATPPPEPIFYLIKEIDKTFKFIEMESHKSPQTSQFLPSIIYEKNQILNFPAGNNNSCASLVKTKIVRDSIFLNDESFRERVTFETLLVGLTSQESIHLKSVSTHLNSEVSGQVAYNKDEFDFYNPKTPYGFKELIFTDSDKTVTGLQLIVEGNKFFASKRILGVTKEEFNELNSLITIHNLRNSSIYLENVNFYTSAEGIDFRKFYFRIIGETPDGNVMMYKPQTDIEIYSLDDYLFFTKSYGELTPKKITYSENITLNFGPWLVQE